MKRKPTTLLNKALFGLLAGTFVEGATLYVNRGTAEMGALELPGTVEDGVLKIEGYSITNGQIYPLASKNDIKGAYLIYDSIEVAYSGTKDGREPSSVSARVLAVDKTYGGVEALADAIEEKLSGAYVAGLGEIELLSRGSDYDASRGDFLEEIKIYIEL